jgi:hypothetical protein
MGLSPITTLSREIAGHQRIHPQRKDVINHERLREAGGVPSISRTTGSSR